MLVWNKFLQLFYYEFIKTKRINFNLAKSQILCRMHVADIQSCKEKVGAEENCPGSEDTFPYRFNLQIDMQKVHVL